MTILRDDTFARRDRREPRSRHVSVLVFILLFLSFALLVLSRLNHPYVQAVRQAVAPWYTPALTGLADMFAPLRDLKHRMTELGITQDELARLRAQNQQLRGWDWRARDLERQLEALGRHAKLVEQTETPLVSARVVADSAGPFARTVLIDAGAAQGVKLGHPVVSAEGLVGRIMEVSQNAARVMLLDDINSRVPVAIGAQGTRAILTGDNTATPALRHVPRDGVLAAGDVVATSGRGGMFPPTLRIGEVAPAADKDVRVRIFADLDRLEFVSVLLYESPVRELVETAASRPNGPGRGR